MGFELVFAVSLLVVGAVNGEQCSIDNDIMVPSNFVMEQTSRYNYKESGLQIYTEMRIPCEGYLTEWRFIAANPLVYGLHIGVFRPQTAGNLQLVDQSYLQALTTPNGAGGVWIYYPLDPPIQVRTGDYVGIFYDRFQTVNDLLTISSQIIQRPTSRIAPTYVFVMDDTDVKKNATIMFSNGDRVYRKPALTAIVSGSLGTTTEIAATETMTTATSTQSTKTTVTTRKTPATTPGRGGRPSPAPKQTTITTTQEAEPSESESETQQNLSFDDSYYSATTPPSVYTRCTGPPTALQVCKRLQLRAYYDYQRGTCRPFFGCESWTNEANNFNSVDECQAFCSAVTVDKPSSPRITPARLTSPPASTECYSTPSASTYCYNPGLRYYFDREQKTCASFYGCPLITNPPANNFDTMDACQRKCRAASAASNVNNGGGKSPIPQSRIKPAQLMVSQMNDQISNDFPSSAQYLIPPAVNPFRINK